MIHRRSSVLAMGLLLLGLVASSCGSASRSEVVSTGTLLGEPTSTQPSAGSPEPEESATASHAGSPAGPVGGAEAEPVDYFELVRQRVDWMDGDAAYATVLEAMPNVTFDYSNGEFRPASSIAVVGEVVKVESSITCADAFAYPELAEADREGDCALVEVDDPRALWRYFDVDLAVSEMISSNVNLDDPSVVHFRVATDAAVSLEGVERSLITGDPVFVIGSSSADGSSDDRFLVALSGGFWFEVDPEGRLWAPGLPDRMVRDFGVSSLKLDDVRASVVRQIVLRPAWDRD